MIFGNNKIFGLDCWLSFIDTVSINDNYLLSTNQNYKSRNSFNNP